MEIIADLHTHTLASTHDFNTVTEMAREAFEMGHRAIDITDHGPKMPDSPHIWHFYNLMRLPQKIEGVYLLRGMEANVLNTRGDLDFTRQELERIRPDWVIASIHSDTLEPGSYSQKDFDRLWMNIAENPWVDMIGHSETNRSRYDYDALAHIFAKNGKVVELNANSVNVRPGSEENMKELALACKRAGARVAVNSDGHSIYHLGRVEHILHLLHEIDFPQELVVNASMKALVQTLKEHKKPVAAIMEGLA